VLSTVVVYLLAVGVLFGLIAAAVGSIFGWAIRAALRQTSFFIATIVPDAAH
jgi:hypothetical protein